MKLRMLNGTHSMLAYAGFLAGLQYVRDVMNDTAMAVLVQRHLQAAGQTLPRLPDMDAARYADALVARFSNPSIAHETWQIAMDGTEKLPQRLLQPAVAAFCRLRRTQGRLRLQWLRGCDIALAIRMMVKPTALRDPQEHRIRALLAPLDDDAAAVCDALQDGLNIFPAELLGNTSWRQMVDRGLATND